MRSEQVTEAEEVHGRLGLDKAAISRRTGLSFRDQLQFTTWQRIGRQISLISDASAWWLGDWLVYGEDKYPDRYKQAIAETSLDYQTLRNYAWVARKFKLSRRREKLSLQHHAAVAALPEHEQEVWLNRAEKFRWSKNELRRQVKLRQSASDESQDRPLITVRLNVTRDCEQRWQEAAVKTNCSLSAWMMQVLDEAAQAALDLAGAEQQASLLEAKSA